MIRPPTTPTPEMQNNTFECGSCGLMLPPKIVYSGIRGLDGCQYSLVKCEPCGVRQAYPRPSEPTLEKFYGTAYEGRCKQGIVEVGDPFNANRAIIEDGLLRLREANRFGMPLGGRLLDVGCGHGFFMAASEKMGFTATGIDIDQDALAYARTKFRFSVHTKTVYELDTQIYDVVSMWQVLEHLGAPGAATGKVFEVLNPGGFFIGSVPNIGGIYAKMRGRKWYHLRPPEHLNYFDEPSLRALLERAGFEPHFVGTISVYAAPYFVWGVRKAIRKLTSKSQNSAVTAAANMAQRALTLLKRHLLYAPLNRLVMGANLGGNSLFWVARRPAQQ